MNDVLAALKPPELAAFYRRLANAVDKNKGTLKVSLAAMLMRQWLDNRQPGSLFEFTAPDHVQDRAPVLETLDYHRRVFLTQKKARLGGGAERWAGIVPRVIQAGQQGKPEIRSVSMNYESLVEIPLRYQVTGDDADKDILYALHGFQLKSTVVVSAVPIAGKTTLRVNFSSYDAEIADTYDWDYTEHLTVPNPDFASKTAGAVEPTQRTIIVYHRNAKRLEDARLAAPYDLRSKPWAVTDARFRGPADVEPKLP